MSESILDNLNPAQKEAVTWGHAPLLILAGAGSGKTRILTRRIAHLISNGVPAFQILGVTFTNKAANEMKHRVTQLVSQDVWISTFHSTCLRILRMDGAAIGLDRQFSIYDDSDQKTLIKECIRDLQMNEKQVHPKGVKERIQRAKDILMTPSQYAEEAEDIYEESVAKVYKLYEEKLTRLKACDFGDLIMKTVQLFDQKPEVLQMWQDRFQHILIDEYQDTNHAQYRLIKSLAQASKQITVVGDPDQSIYAWRGADIQNILNFEKDYPDCGMIRMEQNYRSTGIILDAANELIKRNSIRRPKALWTDRDEGTRIALRECVDEKDEAEHIVNQVLSYQSKGKTLADQVVFYRMHAQSRVIEDALRRSNIPYKIVGGVRFYDRKEIKDMIAYLRVIANPHDDVSLKRIVNVPTRGVGKKAMEILEQVARTNQVPWDTVLSQIDRVEGLTPRTRKSLQSFYAMLKALRRDQHLSPRQVLERILDGTGYVELLNQEKSIEAQSRIENIEEFFSVIEDFEENYRPDATDEIQNRQEGEKQVVTPLQAFLETISLVTDLDTWDGGTNVLTLMSLHSAKGLEFPIVYMAGLEEGIFPNANSYTDDPSEVEEERRLCYVGITRAKDLLHMTYARQRRLYGGIQHNLPSRFLNEIPNELFESQNLFPTAKQDDDDDFFEDLSEDEDLMDLDFDSDDGENPRRILFD